MRNISEEKLFLIGMRWRIGYGILRIVFGLAILKIVGVPFTDVLNTLMSHELVEDPNDLLFSLTSYILEGHPLYVSYFISFYFIFWGVTDTVLSYNLIKHRLWAFPVSFVLIGLFIVYEAVRFTHTHSLILLWVMFLDAIILWLIWREYKKLKAPSMYQDR